MKLDHRGRLVIQFLQQHGPQFGYQLCEQFDVSEQVLLNTMKPLRETGLVVVDRISRSGQRGSAVNRFRLPGADDAKEAQAIFNTAARNDRAPSIFGKFNPQDPFGLAAKRAGSSPHHRQVDFCCSLHPGGKLLMCRGDMELTELEKFEAQQLKQFLNCQDI